jgi:hypothetical protein
MRELLNDWEEIREWLNECVSFRVREQICELVSDRMNAAEKMSQCVVEQVRVFKGK